jgi:hypothetical protein
MRPKALGPAALSLLLMAAPLAAQTNPTGTISGKVVDQQGLAVPGASVTAASPALQGTRSTTTSSNGDYILPFLPAGEYSVTFELPGFATVRRTERVRPAETVTVNPAMDVRTVTETVEVVGQVASEFNNQAQVATSFKADLVEKLPLNRTIMAAVQLAPGVQSSGPSGNVSINGSMSFENLFMVNGVVVNENIRGTANDLFIEDALQETTVSTAAISAEFGRFNGGVVQAITKSGGNQFSGSYRLGVENDDWVALTPFPNDTRIDKVLYTHEATLGGPVFRDKLWFFGAGRLSNRETAPSPTTGTNLSYLNVRDQKRYEGKLTWALNARNTFKGAYTRVDDKEDGNAFTPIMDLASLVNRETPQDLISANYTGIVTSKFFVEGQYSRRRFTFVGSGSQFTDLIRGTLMLDRSRGDARYNSPTFCGVCTDERRDNQNIVAKATYFASTDRWGSHNLVAGLDMFDDKRFANNHQSGSDFRVFSTSTIIRGTEIFPVLDNASIIQWNPIPVESKGNTFRTISGFVNDAWTVNRKLTLNVGLRYDKNDGRDQGGADVVKDAAFSPRLSASFDPRGDGVWTVNASVGQYVAAIANNIGDAASAGGNPATYQFDYRGPTVNTGNPDNPLTTEQALDILWEWFNANGGTNRTTRGAPTIPGVNTRISDRLRSPNSLDFTLGVTRRLGDSGSVRVDGIYRKFRDFYATRIDLSTGQVADPLGRRFDLQIRENTDDLERSFKGLNFQASYRPFTRLNLGGNYTLGELFGNVEGETGPNGPVSSGILSYPEYFDRAWNLPEGELFGSVRHKARVWATWDAPLPSALGRFDLGLLQFFHSGTRYGASGPVDTRPFVTNPGYATPPASVTYFFSERDAFKTADTWRTDLALNWSRRVVKRSEVFFRGTVLNVFNRDELTNFFDTCGTGGCINTTVQTNSNLTSLTRFNPFVDTPVEGTNWRLGPTFGQPIRRFAYQTPRTLAFSVGVRF